MVQRTGIGGGAWCGVAALAIALLVSMAQSGCGRREAAAQPPPPMVTVARPIEREVIDWDEYSGRLSAVETVDVRARVGGFVLSVSFREGGIVNAGDVLFQIDPRPFRADLDRAAAQAQAAEAQVLQAEATFNRTVGAAQSNAVSQQDVDVARFQLENNRAQLAAARAAQETARLNLEWTRVIAPITGRASSVYVTPGNLITGGVGSATLLTTIARLDPIYCYVDVDEQSVLRYQRLARERRRLSARDTTIPVFIQLANETAFPHEGYIDFVDNRIDPATGTMRARGVFPNPSETMTPGMFARMRVPGSGRYRAILVPDAAIGTVQNIRFVMVLQEDGTVQQRNVQLGSAFGPFRSITDGITLQDRVVVNGMLRARPGSKVQATEQPLDASAVPLTAPGSPTTQALPPATQTAHEAATVLPTEPRAGNPLRPPATLPAGVPRMTAATGPGGPADAATLTSASTQPTTAAIAPRGGTPGAAATTAPATSPAGGNDAGSGGAGGTDGGAGAATGPGAGGAGAAAGTGDGAGGGGRP